MTLNGVMALILRYFTEFGSYGAHCVQVVDDVIVKEFAFAMSSPDESLVEICERTHRQTDIHAHRNTSHPYRGQSNENRIFYKINLCFIFKSVSLTFENTPIQHYEVEF